ncbi:MAG: transglutaminase-like cysteine peptidase [Arcobacteraceae bacterium]|nr:transglutaminase-like cysteine peptidase [Arcobacteraceae bacterium]MDY0328394.1 transglutaminase-like cysteine peptidase [Arcobacteraceae bacterium]
MKFVLSIFIIVFVGYSTDYIGQHIFKQVEQKYGKFAVNRFVALDKLMKNLEGKSELEKIEKINNFFNNVRYSSDAKTYGLTDYWATPFEFLARDLGDCEDYVIAKYFTLKHLGIPAHKMYMTYVRVVGYDEAHMVLTYFSSPTSEPIVLDNINKKIFPASQRTDLKPAFNFNPEVLKSGKQTTAHRKWDELLKNMRENKL